jgi:hypothetical protein
LYIPFDIRIREQIKLSWKHMAGMTAITRHGVFVARLHEAAEFVETVFKS